jgi:hypothetical protein
MRRNVKKTETNDRVSCYSRAARCSKIGHDPNAAFRRRSLPIPIAEPCCRRWALIWAAIMACISSSYWAAAQSENAHTPLRRAIWGNAYEIRPSPRPWLFTQAQWKPHGAENISWEKRVDDPVFFYAFSRQGGLDSCLRDSHANNQGCNTLPTKGVGVRSQNATTMTSQSLTSKEAVCMN